MQTNEKTKKTINCFPLPFIIFPCNFYLSSTQFTFFSTCCCCCCCCYFFCFALLFYEFHLLFLLVASMYRFYSDKVSFMYYCFIWIFLDSFFFFFFLLLSRRRGKYCSKWDLDIYETNEKSKQQLVKRVSSSFLRGWQ